VDYKDYIRERLQELTDTKIIVVNEVDFNFTSDDNAITVVIKNNGGAVNGNVKFMPIQFDIYSSLDVQETLAVFNEFVNRYSNTYMNLGLDFYKQDYNTPVVATNFLDVGTTKSYIYITGTLLITTDISDVKEIWIDNKLINHLQCDVIYSASFNPAKASGEDFVETLLESASLTINMRMFCQNDVFSQQLKLIRRGELSPNHEFLIKLVYNDATEEVHRMKVTAFSDTHDVTNAPIRVVNFSL
jgi:hypothetical protein